MLKNKSTYEIISPEDIGLIRSNESGIVLGKLRYAGSTLLMLLLWSLWYIYLFPSFFLQVSKFCDWLKIVFEPIKELKWYVLHASSNICFCHKWALKTWMILFATSIKLHSITIQETAKWALHISVVLQGKGRNKGIEFKWHGKFFKSLNDDKRKVKHYFLSSSRTSQD